MLLIEISNTQSLNLKLNHGLHLDWPILLKSKIKFTKVSARKKIHTKKKIIKDNSKHTIMLYLHYLGRQKNLITNNILRDNKKNLKLVWQTIKGIINMKNKSDESIFSVLIDNQLITSTKQISNHFKIFFTSIAEKINKHCQSKKNSSFISWP